MNSINRGARLAVACAFAAISLGATAGDTLYVKRGSTPVRQGKFAFDPAVATAGQGDAVTVIAVEGNWLRVSYVPKNYASTQPATAVEGYVFGDALAPQPPSTTQPSPDAKVPPKGGILDASAYGQAKALEPDALQKAIADSREAMKNADARFAAFTKAGRIGPHKSAGPTTQP